MLCDDCRYFSICKVPLEKRKDCKVLDDAAFQARRTMIVGKTREEIQRMQGGRLKDK